MGLGPRMHTPVFSYLRGLLRRGSATAPHGFWREMTIIANPGPICSLRVLFLRVLFSIC
jgi:hypothetical protein